ncbi:MAG: hypothetical protein HY744_10275 [Deltaproteobacteria bacterium]|nr:hypothetical protein [Deltaproteobacteria bacterium]
MARSATGKPRRPGLHRATERLQLVVFNGAAAGRNSQKRERGGSRHR